jgi:hypothetical protein
VSSPHTTAPTALQRALFNRAFALIRDWNENCLITKLAPLEGGSSMFRSTLFLAVSLLVTHVGLPAGSVGQDLLPAHDEGVKFLPEQHREGAREVYVNKTFGWSITVPAGWELVSFGNPSLVNFEALDGSAIFGIHSIEHRDFMGKSAGEIADIWLNHWVD